MIGREPVCTLSLRTDLVIQPVTTRSNAVVVAVDVVEVVDAEDVVSADGMVGFREMGEDTGTAEWEGH